MGVRPEEGSTMTDPPRRRFAATLVALAVGLAGCTDDDTGNPDDGGNPDDAAVDLSDNGLDGANETGDDRNASDADDD